MLKACFVGCLTPTWAESILTKKSPGCYLVRQGDSDPEQLLLSFASEKGIKHVIVPKFQDSIFVVNKLNRFKNRLTDECIEVQKLLISLGCKDPVSPECEAQPK